MTRDTLPQRRECWRFPLKFRNHEFTIQISVFEDGSPAEVFCTGLKSGADFQHLSRDGAILLSIALQYGVPLDVIRKSLSRDEQDEPSSLLCAIADRIGEEADVYRALRQCPTNGDGHDAT